MHIFVLEKAQKKLQQNINGQFLDGNIMVVVQFLCTLINFSDFFCTKYVLLLQQEKKKLPDDCLPNINESKKEQYLNQPSLFPFLYALLYLDCC